MTELYEIKLTANAVSSERLQDIMQKLYAVVYGQGFVSMEVKRADTMPN